MRPARKWYAPGTQAKRRSLQTAGDRWSWQEAESDWRRLLDRKDIDLIDICVPNSLHRDIAIAALQAGKMVATERPLALNVRQGKEMVDAATKSGKKTLVWFNQRRFPPVTLAKQMIYGGTLGQVFHYRATYLQDWAISADAPLGGSTFWRMDAKEAGSGVTGDLLAHTLDIAMWLNGPIAELSAQTETFIKERKRQGGPATIAKVEIDDASQCMARFTNGSMVGAGNGAGVRAYFRACRRRFSGGPRRWKEEGARFLRWAEHADRVRYDPRIREKRAVDKDGLVRPYFFRLLKMNYPAASCGESSSLTARYR
jgi:predicted dehydrogenase